MDPLGGIQWLPLRWVTQHATMLSLLRLLLSFESFVLMFMASDCLERHRRVRMKQHVSVLFWLQYNSVDRMYIQHTQSLFAEIIKFSKDARRRNT